MGQSDGQTNVTPTTSITSGPQTDAIFRSVKDNFISPLIAAFKIEAVNADSTALVIKVNDIYDGTETSINNVFTNINLGTFGYQEFITYSIHQILFKQCRGNFRVDYPR